MRKEKSATGTKGEKVSWESLQTDSQPANILHLIGKAVCSVGDHESQLSLAGLGTSIRAKAMKVSLPQVAICWVLIALTPASLLAADIDPGGAMLYGRGKEPVLLNGKPLPRSSAVFPGDLIQTPSESVATLDAPGSGVVVYPDSVVKFEQNSVLSLIHI